MKRRMTGVEQADGDWPGIFIRGDDALAFAGLLAKYLQRHPSDILGSRINELIRLLLSCRVEGMPEVPPQRSQMISELAAMINQWEASDELAGEFAARLIRFFAVLDR